MKQYILFLFLLISSFSVFSQVKIGADGSMHPTGNYPTSEMRETQGHALTFQTIAERNAIPANFRDTGMLVLIRDSTAIYTLVGGITNANWQKIAISSIPIENGLFQPGYVTWSGAGLTFDVTGAIYVLQGIIYNSPAGSVTLTDADPIQPRIDVIAVDNTGSLVVITGDAAENPSVPQVDPATQVELTSVLIPAGATVPSVNQMIIYDENTENWTGLTANLTLNLDATNNPYHLTRSADVGTWTATRNITFTRNSATEDISAYTMLRMQIWLKQPFPASGNINITFLNGTTVVSGTITLTGAQGFSRTLDSVWQNISIPTSVFNFTNNNFNKVRIQMTGASGASGGYYFDYLQLQGGIAPPPDGDPFVVNYSKNSTDDSTILLLSNNQRYAASDRGGEVNTIYNADDTLSGNRIVNGGNYSLTFNDLSRFKFGRTSIYGDIIDGADIYPGNNSLFVSTGDGISNPANQYSTLNLTPQGFGLQFQSGPFVTDTIMGISGSYANDYIDISGKNIHLGRALIPYNGTDDVKILLLDENNFFLRGMPNGTAGQVLTASGTGEISWEDGGSGSETWDDVLINQSTTPIAANRTVNWGDKNFTLNSLGQFYIRTNTSNSPYSLYQLAPTYNNFVSTGDSTESSLLVQNNNTLSTTNARLQAQNTNNGNSHIILANTDSVLIKGSIGVATSTTLIVPGLPTANDTTTYKPLTVNTTTGRVYKGSWSGSGGGSQNLQSVLDVGNSATDQVINMSSSGGDFMTLNTSDGLFIEAADGSAAQIKYGVAGIALADGIRFTGVSEQAGVVPLEVTTTQRDALTGEWVGQFVWNTTTDQFEYNAAATNDPANWQPLVSGGTTTLQNAFDNSITATDNPLISSGANTFNIAGTDESVFSFSPQTSILQSTNLAENTLATISTEASDTANTNVTLRAGGGVIGRDHFLKVFPNYLLIGNTVDEGYDNTTKVIIENPDTLLTEPEFVYVSDADTLKKYPFPVGGGGTPFLPNSGTGIATGDITGNLDSDFTLSIEGSDGYEDMLHLDPTPGSELAILQAYNPTGDGNFATHYAFTQATQSVLQLTSAFNNTVLAQITATTTADTALVVYGAETHAFYGNVSITNGSGSWSLPHRDESTTTSFTDNDYTINATSGSFTTTLPTAVGIEGRIYNITNSGAGTITLATTSSQTFINITSTPTTLSLSPVGAGAVVGYTVQSNGANWIVIGKVKNE